MHCCHKTQKSVFDFPLKDLADPTWFFFCFSSFLPTQRIMIAPTRSTTWNDSTEISMKRRSSEDTNIHKGTRSDGLSGQFFRIFEIIFFVLFCNM